MKLYMGPGTHLEFPGGDVQARVVRGNLPVLDVLLDGSLSVSLSSETSRDGQSEDPERRQVSC